MTNEESLLWKVQTPPLNVGCPKIYRQREREKKEEERDEQRRAVSAGNTASHN